MSSLVATDPAGTRLLYDWAADRYLQSLPLEHFMESTQQSTQREITLESLALVRSMPLKELSERVEFGEARAGRFNR
ncbi:MAG TPA: hypothetical protein VN641_14025 [Urbifossiella sp.]|nr:hypothetical protein [Urbifossiella sp.]